MQYRWWFGIVSIFPASSISVDSASRGASRPLNHEHHMGGTWTEVDGWILDCLIHHPYPLSNIENSSGSQKMMNQGFYHPMLKIHQDSSSNWLNGSGSFIHLFDSSGFNTKMRYNIVYFSTICTMMDVCLVVTVRFEYCRTL